MTKSDLDKTNANQSLGLIFCVDCYFEFGLDMP